MNPKQFHRRLIGVVLVLAILMTFLCSNLYSIQYVNGEDYANQSVARSYENQTVPASRGPILDRNGKVLVSNQISYQVTLSLSLMGETEEERCANLLTLIQVCREEGVTWADTLPITTTAPFSYTTEDPFYSVSTDENGNPEYDEDGELVYDMTRLGRLAVYMGWIEDPTELAEGEIPESDASGGAEPGLWDRIMNFFGMGQQEEAPQEEPEPYQLPTAEELLGMMCKSFGVKGEGAVDEAAAKESGETVPTLNIGDMSETDARAVAGVLYELYYRSRITNWPIYYFAEDVDVDFITRVKELGIKGVEIETASVRKYETEFAAHLLGRVAAMEPTRWTTTWGWTRATPRTTTWAGRGPSWPLRAISTAPPASGRWSATRTERSPPPCGWRTRRPGSPWPRSRGTTCSSPSTSNCSRWWRSCWRSGCPASATRWRGPPAWCSWWTREKFWPPPPTRHFTWTPMCEDYQPKQQ